MSTFIEVGVPTIRFAQKRGAANLLNLSTVATFFSAVTAMTLQYSYMLNSTTGHVVNLFWFLSLVFSIAAAVNSLLGLTWKQAMYRSPGLRVPWWVLIWIKRSPLVFLVMSVVCFWIGLCTFTFASNQSRVTSIVTTVFTVFTSCSLGAISIWWTSERWSFTHRRGKEWLVNTVRQLFHLSSKRKNLQRRIVTHIKRLGTQLRRVAKSLIGKDTEIRSDVESGSPKLKHPNVPTASGTKPLGTLSINLVTMEFTEPVTSREMGRPLNKSTMDPAVPIGKELWRNALRIAKMNRAMSNHGSANYQNHRQRTSSSTSSVDLKLDAIRVQSRLNALVPKLESLTPMQGKVAHRALIWNLQFSPDGKFLATSSWDKTSVIFRVQASSTIFIGVCHSYGLCMKDSVISVYRRLAHPRGVVKQVAWSPGSHLLLTRLSRSINVWTQHGILQKTISRPTIVESIVWLPGTGEDFLSVEGSNVVKLNSNGKISGIYKFTNMNLQGIAVTPDGTRLLGVGTLLHSVDGLRPRLSRTEKRIAVYNIDTNQIETLVPVLSNVKGITVVPNSHNDFLTLISYEDKATPQLWKLDVSKNTSRLTIHQRYFPKVPTDFAGPSYFGGTNEELVLCVDKIGDLHIWDRESGTLLHRIRAHELGRDVTCIAWNHPHDPFMFATGSLHGSVHYIAQRIAR
ncbi:WD40-repeat-containing domain protein [Lentinula lateritia]|uniref:WD40-repeat-containing domain protein n=1 Tax=Lentinula lateritia TaxID=40482 RepID=A0ABQ8VH85_9AGAR|nr:WD40-repeat-containing domain protein [Lentinula lateritia]